MRPTAAAMLLVTLVFHGICVAIEPAITGPLPKEESDGWHSWTIDSENPETLFVRLKSGQPVEIRNVRSNCAPVPRGQTVTDHGIVSAEENFVWFRKIFENRTFSRRIREGALHGLALSDTDEAFTYLDGLIMQE